MKMTTPRKFHSTTLHLLIIGFLLYTWLASSCVGRQTAQPQDTTIVPIASPTQSPATQANTPSPTQTHTSVPQDTATQPPPTSDFPLERLALLFSDGDRNLYLLTAAGSQKIAALPAEDTTCPTQAAFSPDGKWLAYIAGRGLMVGQRESGSFATVLSSEDLAANSPPSQGGWIEPSNLSWIPGSDQLLFTTIEEGVPFASRRYDLYQYDAETGELKRLLPNDRGGEIYPNPTGRWVALAQATHVSLLDLQTGQTTTVLEYPAISTHTETYFIPVIEWLADGSAFQTTVPPDDPVIRPEDPSAIWRVTASTGKAGQLGQVFMGFQAQRAYFSPDGTRLAYQHRYALDGPVTIFIKQVDGGETRQVMSGLFDLKGWAPGGGSLLIYDRTARQSLSLSLDGQLSPLPSFGVILGGQPLAYRPLEQGLASQPRLLDERYSTCAWSLLPPGSIQAVQITPLALPSATASPIPTQKPSPTITQTPTETPQPSATPLPGSGSYNALATLKAHQDAVNALAFQPEGLDTLASGGKDGRIYLWNVSDERRTAEMENPGGGVNGLAWSTDGRRLASVGGGSEPAVRIWVGDSGQLQLRLNSPGGALYSVAFSPDGSQLAAAGKDGVIRVWNPSDGSLLQEFQAHQSAIWGLAFSLDGQKLYSASSDQTVCAWTALSGELLWQENTGKRVYALALSRDGRWLAAGLENGGFWLSDLNLPGVSIVVPLEQITVNSLAFHPTYPLLALGSNQGRVLLYDLNMTAVVNEWTAHKGWVLALAWNTQGDLLASGGGEGDNRVIIWGR